MKDTTIALAAQNSIPGESEYNLQACINLAEKASEAGASIIVFPEMNLTGYCSGKALLEVAVPLSEKICSALSETAKTNEITIAAGLAHLEHNHKIYASHMVVFPDAGIQVYKKIHAAPPERETLSTGEKIGIFQTKTLKFGIQLCYDAHFPELSTRMALEGADIIMIPHASPRGSGQEKLDSWMRHLTARAFDNSVFIAAVNQVGNNGRGLNFPGVSVIIGPDGKILSKSISNRENLLVAKLETACLESVRNHRMKYFLPNRREDLYFS
ncbi:MAG: nitrilase-related carbon-nitrogen hydrolase [Desulfobacteraceae bacterium]